jgi:hypothetical protein
MEHMQAATQVQVLYTVRFHCTLFTAQLHSQCNITGTCFTNVALVNEQSLAFPLLLPHA